MATTDRTVVGLFHDRSHAEEAIRQLHARGFAYDDIGFAERGATGGLTRSIEDSDRPGDTGAGAAGGALAGAGIGGIVAAGASLLIPGFGPVIASGILATILGGAAIGAAAGGLIGALTGMGLSDDEAHYYQDELEHGSVLVTVNAGTRHDEARQILLAGGAYDTEHPGDLDGATETMHHGDMGMTGTTSGTMHRDETIGSHRDDNVVQLHEERLQARTESVPSGEVTVSKEIVTEHKSMDVPVTHEEVVVERRPIEGRPATGAIREGEEIRVPVHEERVDVTKHPVAYEEVEVSKRDVHDTEHVQADVRREEARVDRTGDVKITGWDDDVSNQYHQRWQSRYGTSGSRWEDDQAYYRYGHEMSNMPAYRGRSWTDVEPTLRQGYGTWAGQHGYSSDPSMWERFKDRVQDAWENTTQRRAA